MSSHSLVLVAIAAENPASQGEDVGHGSRFFSAFVAISRYSALTWILNLTEIWSCLKCTFKTTIFQSQAQSFSSPGLLIDVLRSIPSQLGDLLWLGSNAQTLWKAEISDHAPVGRKKALAQSLSKSLLTFETCQKSPVFTRCPHNSGVGLNAATLSADLNIVVCPWSDRLSSLGRLKMSHK